MRLSYYPDTDSLYVELSDKDSVDSIEISEGVVVDYGNDGNVVGIDIDNASKKLDLKKLTILKLPLELQEMVG
ncbi:MAG TPA: DUF2283 domain-containing protein [Candidatus Kaiserbacteria bacterium]|nr:DUF2283 domain-containing protein [Candidatus Kaiserbacteria bacterium]